MGFKYFAFQLPVHLEDVYTQKADSVISCCVKQQSNRWLLLVKYDHKRVQSCWLGCSCLVLGIYGI